MYKYLKVGDDIYLNTTGVEERLVGFDENGNPIVDVKNILPDSYQELQKVLMDTLLYLERARLQKVLEQYGYNGLSDVQFYVSQNDAEAQSILSWYQAYDDAIWNYIDSLMNKTKAEILNDLKDVPAIEEQIYQQSIQNNPLP